MGQIRAGKAEKARAALVDLLRKEPNNAQAWYLLSFTLDDPQRQEYAVLQALRINPEFEKARNRLLRLRGEPVGLPVAGQESAPDDRPQEGPQSTVPTFFEEAEKPSEPDQPQETTAEGELRGVAPPTRPRGRNRLFLFLVIVVVVLAIFAASVFFPSINITKPSVTPIASQTLPSTWTPTAQPTATLTRTPTASLTAAPTETSAASDTAAP